MKDITLYISSDVFNVANFLLFDLFLAAFVYSLTADLAGLENSKIAFREEKERLCFHNPPLVGVGITCTHRRVAYVLAFIRVLSLLLIFSTVFAPVGEDEPVYFNTTAKLVVLGNLSVNEDYISVAPRALARQGCQGRTDTATYYGQLLGNGDCELDRSRIPPPVQFGFLYEAKKLSLQRCETKHHRTYYFPCENGYVVCMYSNVTVSAVAGSFQGCTLRSKKPAPKCTATDSSNSSFTCNRFPNGTGKTILKRCKRHAIVDRHFFLCGNARISCQPDNKKICAGTVNVEGEIYFCRGAGLYKGFESNTTSCRKVEGVDWSLTDWLPHYPDAVRDLEYAFAALYGSGLKETTVTLKKSRLVTKLKPFWFIALAMKLLAIISLGMLVLASRNLQGLQRVANDEVGLASLLMCIPTFGHSQLDSRESEVAPESRSSVVVEMERGTVRIKQDSGDRVGMELA